MSRIGASLSGIERRLLNSLAEANSAAALGTMRLTTDRRIQAPVNDVSAFTQLSGLTTQLSAVNGTLANVSVASSMAAEVQLAVDQIRTELNTIRTKALEDEDQSLTDSERAANQVAINAAIDRINELAGTNSQGKRFLDGSADFSYSNVNTSEVVDVQAFSLGSNSSATISGTVSIAAEQATLSHAEGTGLITNDATITLTGDRGSVSIDVTTGESLATVAARVNAESHRTGVTAADGGTTLDFTSIGYGTDESITIAATSGTFNGEGTDAGVDATATINGIATTGDGATFTVSDANGLHATVQFDASHTGAFDTITISGEPATFALSTDLAKTTQFIVRGAQAARLGGLSGVLTDLATGGSAAGLNSNASLAVRIVDEALGDLTLIEGQVDSFADGAVASSSALLAGMKDILEDAIEEVDGVNSQEEAVLLAKNQTLASNAISSLAILDQQRQSALALIQQIAGI